MTWAKVEEISTIITFLVALLKNMLCVIKKDQFKQQIPITYNIAKKLKKPKIRSVLNEIYEPIPMLSNLEFGMMDQYYKVCEKMNK
jgi:hypothetical protein